MIQLLVNLFKAFNKQEKFLLAGAVLVCLVSGILWGFAFINQKTIRVPSQGGTYIEGVVGQPSFVNPLLAKSNTPDADLVTLIFASAYDMAENIKHDKNYKVWDLRIKEGATWHDGSPITSDDIIFTIQTIQNPSTLSPSFSDWQNIIAQRVSEREVRFELATPYSLFENILKDLRPVPKKLFADLSQAPLNLRLSPYMLEPIGSGPFMYDYLKKRKDGFILSYSLKRNDNYAAIGKVPYIKNLVINFYENNEKLINAYNLGLIDGFGTYDNRIIDQIKLNSKIIPVPTSKYYAIFFNQNANSQLANLNIRKALSISIDKESIVNLVFSKNALIEHGPIPPSLPSYNPAVESIDSYNPQLAKDLIAQAGWQLNPETNIWEKNEKDQTLQLSITLKTANLYPQNSIAQIVKDNWKAIGINASVVLIDPQEIEDKAIRTRDYEALLYGNIVSLVPDLYSFWNSTQKFYPGYNLALYDNSQVDALIDLARQIDPESSQRQEKLDQIQKIIAQDFPAAFLVSPYYFYIHKRSLEGISFKKISVPESRFLNVNQWFTKTKKVFN